MPIREVRNTLGRFLWNLQFIGCIMWRLL